MAMNKVYYCIPQINSYSLTEAKRCHDLYEEDKCSSGFLPPEEKGLCSVLRFAAEDQLDSEKKSFMDNSSQQ